MAFIPPSNSKPLSFRQLKGEFGKSGTTGSVSLGDLYKNGSNVKDNGSVSTIPTSGAISLNNFYNTKNKHFYLIRQGSSGTTANVFFYQHHSDNFTFVDTNGTYGFRPAANFDINSEFINAGRGKHVVSSNYYNVLTIPEEVIEFATSFPRYGQAYPATFKVFGSTFYSYNSTAARDYQPSTFVDSGTSATWDNHYVISPFYYSGTEYRTNAHAAIDPSTGEMAVATGYYASNNQAWNYCQTHVNYEANIYASSTTTTYVDAATGTGVPGYVLSSATSNDGAYYAFNVYNSSLTPRARFYAGRRSNGYNSVKNLIAPNDGDHDYMNCVSVVNDPGAGPATNANTGAWLVSYEKYIESYYQPSGGYLTKTSAQPSTPQYMEISAMCWDPTDTYCALSSRNTGYSSYPTLDTNGYTFFLKRTNTGWTTIYPNVKNTDSYGGRVSSIAWDETSTYCAMTFYTYNSTYGGSVVIFKRSGDTFTKLTAFNSNNDIRGCGFYPPGTYSSLYG